jgi:ankyrin repeat protein
MRPKTGILQPMPDHRSVTPRKGAPDERTSRRRAVLLLALLAALFGFRPAVAEELDPRAWDGNLETMHLYAAPSAMGKTELMTAAGEGDLPRVLALLEAGAEIDERNANGGTALMYAVSNNHLEVVSLLLARGADPNARARIGWTPMLVAGAKGRDRAIALLLEAGADPAQADAYGWTPLMRAVSGGYIDAVLILLESGRVDLGAREESGATALHIAAGYGQVEIVRVLLQAGAEPLAVDSEGRTPADVARLQGHAAAEALLRS